ncbi:hypothetical protein EYF80_049828 [Liparis tanakae]|uniref:Uncharacterized protein n=1 Tax=Liparis tanakae TaxID=230148 RepID=A0A4Z2FFP5_9TELE|nr:hypothetical protein EYF80_049828 [Liparis tanakae]
MGDDGAPRHEYLSLRHVEASGCTRTRPAARRHGDTTRLFITPHKSHRLLIVSDNLLPDEPPVQLTNVAPDGVYRTRAGVRSQRNP